MSDFDHVVLTRFNVRLTGMEGSAASEAWLRERVTRFERDCIPSFKSQTVQSFTWILLVDADSPPWLEPALRTATDSLSMPVFVRSVAGVLDERKLANVVSEFSTSAFLLTSRVDNDDIIARDFIEVVQSSFIPRHRVVLDVPRGAQVEDGRFYLRCYRLGPFISYIEETAHSMATVLRDAHPSMADHGEVHVVPGGEPLWLQVLHGSNFANHVEGWRADPAPYRQRFPSASFRESGRVAVALDRVGRVGALLLSIPRRGAAKVARQKWVRRKSS